MINKYTSKHNSPYINFSPTPPPCVILDEDRRFRLTPLEQSILLEVNNGNGLFSDLYNKIEGFKGDATFQDEEKKLVFWLGLSEEAKVALANLEKLRLVRVKPVNVFFYTNSGRVINGLKIAEHYRKYKTWHWLPIVYIPVK
jgi:hypothetical protein